LSWGRIRCEASASSRPDIIGIQRALQLVGIGHDPPQPRRGHRFQMDHFAQSPFEQFEHRCGQPVGVERLRRAQQTPSKPQ